MTKDQKARKALEWDKKEVYGADAKLFQKNLKKQKKTKFQHNYSIKSNNQA